MVVRGISLKYYAYVKTAFNSVFLYYTSGPLLPTWFNLNPCMDK